MMVSSPPPPDASPHPPWLTPAVLVATVCGLGRSPRAPGTCGAAAGVAVSAGLAGLGLPLAAETAVVVAINVLGVPICTAAARRLGRGTDPGAIVYDELASVPLGLLVIPAAERTTLPGAAAVLIVAFLLHRLFDVTKPFPCRLLERFPGGLGIMADDWGAAAWMAAALATGRACGWL